MSKKVKYVSDNTLRYFLQKVKALISGKADKTPATNYANGLMSKEDYSKLHNFKTTDITDFPTSMPPTSHSHDDRYYTESEINSKLNDKANSSHNHSSSSIEISQSTIDAYKSMGMV